MLRAQSGHNVLMKKVYRERFKNPDNDPRGAYILTDVTAPFDRPKLRYSWGGKLPPDGRCWRFSQEKAMQLEKDGMLSFSNTGMPRLKRFLADLEQATDPNKNAIDRKRVQIIVRSAMKGIAEELARNPEVISYIEWRDLERVLREVFEGLGFETELTRSGKDGGYDLRISYKENNESITYLVEVKHWKNSGKKVGDSVISSFIDVVVTEPNVHSGLILSSSGFTKSVVRGRVEIEQSSVKLGSEQKIISLCRSYVEANEGIWTPNQTLSETLLCNTF